VAHVRRIFYRRAGQVNQCFVTILPALRTAHRAAWRSLPSQPQHLRRVDPTREDVGELGVAKCLNDKFCALAVVRFDKSFIRAKCTFNNLRINRSEAGRTDAWWSAFESRAGLPGDESRQYRR
jgi:hypothetical protein